LHIDENACVVGEILGSSEAKNEVEGKEYNGICVVPFFIAFSNCSAVL